MSSSSFPELQLASLYNVFFRHGMPPHHQLGEEDLNRPEAGWIPQDLLIRRCHGQTINPWSYRTALAVLCRHTAHEECATAVISKGGSLEIYVAMKLAAPDSSQAGSEREFLATVWSLLKELSGAATDIARIQRQDDISRTVIEYGLNRLRSLAAAGQKHFDTLHAAVGDRRSGTVNTRQHLSSILDAVQRVMDALGAQSPSARFEHDLRQIIGLMWSAYDTNKKMGVPEWFDLTYGWGKSGTHYPFELGLAGVVSQ